MRAHRSRFQLLKRKPFICSRLVYICPLTLWYLIGKDIEMTKVKICYTFADSSESVRKVRGVGLTASVPHITVRKHELIVHAAVMKVPENMRFMCVST